MLTALTLSKVSPSSPLKSQKSEKKINKSWDIKRGHASNSNILQLHVAVCVCVCRVSDPQRFTLSGDVEQKGGGGGSRKAQSVSCLVRCGFWCKEEPRGQTQVRERWQNNSLCMKRQMDVV